jgi:hypothetical protein
MWDIHHEISRLALLGLKSVEIAERLGVSEAMVSYTLNSQVVKDKMEIMQGARDKECLDIMVRIKESVPKALDVLEQIMTGDASKLGQTPSLNLRARTAENWMDRAGYPAQKPGSNLHLHGHFTAQDIEEIKQRARQNPQVIDI